MSKKIRISPQTLAWAITRAGYILENFLESFPHMKKWLNQEKHPSIFEIERLSYYLNVPFGYLLQPTPPKKTPPPILFFKTHENGTSAQEVSFNVYNLILLMQGRQEWLTHYLKNNGTKPYTYVGKFNLNADPEDVADHIRDTFELSEYWPRAFDTWEKAFNFLIKKIKQVGIIMAFSSSLKQDNFHLISLDECRGIVLASPLVPYIYINTAEIKATQMFTVIYSLAHIWVGQTCGFDFVKLCPANTPSELLCYKIAAEFLAPTTMFYTAWMRRRDNNKMVKLFRLSPIVVARRVADLGELSEFDFHNFYDTYTARVLAKQVNWMSTGGVPYTSQRRRVGLLLFKYMQQAVREDQLLYYEAYRLSKINGEVCKKMLKQS